MQREIQAITQIDRTVHEPARLAILAVLSSCTRADFKALRHMTGLSKGNLSVQLRKLEDAGYIQITKSFKGRYSHTDCALTELGRTAFNTYWRQYEALKAAIIT